MAKVIEIQQKYLPKLIDILKLLPAKTQQLTWTILDLEATGDVTTVWPKGMLNLEETIKNSPQGLVLSWDELISLTQTFHQIINAVIIGCWDVSLIPPLETGCDLSSNSELVLEAIDSAVWQVYTQDDNNLSQIQQEFSNQSAIALI